MRVGLNLGYLHGIPCTVKDVFNVSSLPTTARTHLL
jgi:Asp-tRNA(Asn)/Glu-tRNA(Gln) amidotransferase A subunit family amidase